MNKQINHDKHPDESKPRTHRLSKLPDDGEPWAPNNLLTPEQKKNTSWTPLGQATDKKLRPQPTKIRAVAGQRSSPALCFATKSIKSMTKDIDLNVTQVGRDTSDQYLPTC